MSVKWLEEPEKHDYPAAAAYLALVANPDEVESIVKALKDAPVTHQKAKDILRASRLELLNEDNPHVQADLEKIRRGEKLSPILLVRGNLALGFPLQIADGYHRVCASYHTDENTDIPVKIAELPAAVD
ncbi:hypothetical protein [Sinomonas gamaensis]|uniref:hypothetical protein n=1 Tax=Sinomonas gamaensis TaxID=2565624 RepID=UPI00110A06C8|nr:hypothetical protein [Sinomonas gamaensis]